MMTHDFPVFAPEGGGGGGANLPLNARSSFGYDTYQNNLSWKPAEWYSKFDQDQALLFVWSDLSLNRLW